MMDEVYSSSLSYISKKLEKLPLSDYLFSSSKENSSLHSDVKTEDLIQNNDSDDTKSSKDENVKYDRNCLEICEKTLDFRLSPTFSETSPTRHVKKSPNKRKRSTDQESIYDDLSVFSRSCDFEVSNICKRDFRSIQRTLSFDDDLLRCQTSDKTLSTSKFTSMKFTSGSEVDRIASKSQPTSMDLHTCFEKPPKIVKISQITSTNNSKIKFKNIIRDSDKTALPEKLLSQSDDAFSFFVPLSKQNHVFRPIAF